MPPAVVQFPLEVAPGSALPFFLTSAPERTSDFVAALLADINACISLCTIVWPGTNIETAHDQIISLKGLAGLATGSQALCAACDQLMTDFLRGVDRETIATRYIEIANQSAGVVERFAARIVRATGQDPAF